MPPYFSVRVMKDHIGVSSWAQIVGFRNILIHAYFGIDWDLVWDAAKADCPVLREQIAQILAAESRQPEDEGGSA